MLLQAIEWALYVGGFVALVLWFSAWTGRDERRERRNGRTPR